MKNYFRRHQMPGSNKSSGFLLLETAVIAAVFAVILMTANAADAICTAVIGVCGSASGVAVSTAPTANLCSIGGSTAVTGTGPWTWTCTGAFSGANASC